MTDPKEKKPPIRTRAPGKLPSGGMFDRVKLREVHPLEEILADTIEEKTVAPHATVAREATDAPQPTVAPAHAEPLHDATVALETTDASQTTVAQYAIVETRFTSVPNDIWDVVMPTLDVYDQAVLWRLYRLSRGFGKDTCKVGLQRLADQCNIGKRQVSKSIVRLEGIGLIKRLEPDLSCSTKTERGNVYYINLPAAQRTTVARGATDVPRTTVARGAHIKDKALKETNKRELASLDIKSCPDCQGSGFYYPDGFEGGVSKCKHEKLIP